MAGGRAVDEAYWCAYDGLQAAKHTILRRYLGGWYPILGKWHGRIAYIDCCAGRGRHLTGQAGSPLLALQELLNHRMRDRILSRSEVVFLFLEGDEHNAESLRAELEALGRLPVRIRVAIKCEDFDRELRSVLNSIRSEGVTIAPTFAFIDPYGFKISMATLNDLLSFPRTEILLNFMYRYVVMAMARPGQEANLNSLFGGPEWRGLSELADHQERATGSISLFGAQLRARFVTHMHMMGANDALKYVMLHATNHEAGRDLMKDAMWAVAPDGGFKAFERNNPEQQVLLMPQPDLSPLKNALWERFGGKTVRMQEIYDWLRGELYLKAHLHTVLRKGRKDGALAFSGVGSRFAFSGNPEVSFPALRPRQW